MRFLILFSTILLVFACSQEEEITEVTKIFSMDEVSSAGFKVKKDFFILRMRCTFKKNHNYSESKY